MIYNETAVRETHIVLNGKERHANPYEQTEMLLVGHRCIGPCVEEVDFSAAAENRTRYWSVANDWKDADGVGEPPEEGGDAHILPAWNMVYDLTEPSPIYKLVRINGNLTFATDRDLHFRDRKSVV